MPWKLVRDSCSKLVAYFTDGNSRTFYSLDWSHRYSRKKDREIGLTRLRKLVQSWRGKAETAIIYDTHTGKELERYQSGILQSQTINRPPRKTDPCPKIHTSNPTQI